METKAVTADFNYRGSCGWTSDDLKSKMKSIEKIFEECDDILIKAELSPIEYEKQTELIEAVGDGMDILRNYANNAWPQASFELDQPLMIGFANGATETLSRINLNDITTENSFNMEEHYLVDDSGYMYVYGKRIKKDLTMSDFMGLGQWEEREWLPTLDNMETVGIFATLFRLDYRNLSPEDMDVNEYLKGFLASGEFDHKAYHPVRDFLSAVADVTIILPLIESMVGYDFITGEDLTDWECGIKAAGALIDLVTFGNGAILTNAAKAGVKEFVIAVAKTMAVDALSSGVTYLTGEMLEGLGLPPGTAKIMTAVVSGTVTYAAGKYFFKDAAGNVIQECTETELDKMLKGEMDDITPEISAVKGRAVDDVIEGGRDTVDDILKRVENGDIVLTNNIQKGNYGEMKMDAYFESQGYKRMGSGRISDLDAPAHQGIDGVYYNPDGHPPYVIGEAKYGSARLSTLTDGTPQMSNKWIIDRLDKAVGTHDALDIKMEMILNPDNVGTFLIHTSPDGSIDITELIDGIKQ